MTYESFLFFRRVFRWSIWNYFCNANDFSHSLALQRTAPGVTANCVMHPVHVYEVRPYKDQRGVDLISDALPFGRLWYGDPNTISNAIGYAKFRRRSHDAVIRVYDECAEKL
jgi:hypothetical protein